MQRLSNILRERNTIVIKVGTNLLAEKERGINADWIDSIAKNVSYLRSIGKNVAIVSSGAIGAGVAAMRLPDARKQSRRNRRQQRSGSRCLWRRMRMHSGRSASPWHKSS